MCVRVCVCVGGGGGGDEYVLGHKFDTMFIMARAGQCVSWGGVIVGVWMGCWEEGGGRSRDDVAAFHVYFSYILLVVIYVVLSWILPLNFSHLTLNMSENAVKRSEFV